MKQLHTQIEIDAPLSACGSCLLTSPHTLSGTLSSAKSAAVSLLGSASEHAWSLPAGGP